MPAIDRSYGLPLSDAALMDIEAAFIVSDERQAYGEVRLQAYGLIGGLLHVLAFTMRGDALRAISLRRANTREVKRYG